jgi:hypothetical protein
MEFARQRRGWIDAEATVALATFGHRENRNTASDHGGKHHRPALAPQPQRPHLTHDGCSPGSAYFTQRLFRFEHQFRKV